MKIKLLLLLLVLTATHSYGQIKFEKGYLIDNENYKTDCLIKNYDWKNNPSELEYKLSENDKVKKSNLFSIKEFGIYGISKFIRFDTKIDRSSEELTTLSTQRNPVWSEERLFLKVLVEGKACLYQYRDRNFVRYFYTVSDSSLRQLIYKEYYATEKGVACNNDFRQQLWNDVRNVETTSSIENINYTQSELESYFKQYNQNEQQLTVSYNNNKNRDFLVIRITPGINYSTLSVMQNIYGAAITKDQNLNFRIGMEADFILPFNKNKWGIIFAPSYQYFNSSTQNGSYKVDVDYKSLEFPLGLRYSLFLNDDLKVFINGFLIPKLVFNFNSTVDITFGYSKNHLDVTNNSSYAIGGGIDYKKLSLEFRYYSNSNLLRTYRNAWTEYHRFSFILGYTLFKIHHT